MTAKVRTLNKHRHYPAIPLKQKIKVHKSSGSEHVAKVFDFGLSTRNWIHLGLTSS